MSKLPAKFLELLEQIYPQPSVYKQLLSTFCQRPSCLRVNTLKAEKTQVLEELRRANIKFQKANFSELTYIVDNQYRKQLTQLPAYIDGKIYLQSLASQVPVLVLDPKPGDSILDLTAAPGSKTSQIAALQKRQGILYANEQNKPRFFKLMHNMQHLGVLESEKSYDDYIKLILDNGIVMPYKQEIKFDKILLDTPCSAESRFLESDPKTYRYWHIKKVKTLVSTQKRLLKSAFTALKVGGTLVYSTCTINPYENEIQIDNFLKKHPNAKLLPINIPGLKRGPILGSFQDKPISPELQKTLRVFPDKQIESFYVAKIQKTAEDPVQDEAAKHKYS